MGLIRVLLFLLVSAPAWGLIHCNQIVSSCAFPPNGAAGGDLSGTYPNPTVSKINGVAYNADPLAQYLKLGGRSGSSNNPTISSDSNGLITGSGTSGGLVLQLQSNPLADGAISLVASEVDVGGLGGLPIPLRWFGGGFHVGITANSPTASIDYTLPDTAPAGTGRYLTSTTGGVMSWAQPTAAQIISGAALTKTDDTNVTMTLGGSPSTALLAASSMTLGWTGTLAIGRGGTGSGTALGGFNNLSPLTTRGDLLTRDASNNVRLGIGSAATYLRSNGTDPSWQSIPFTDLTSTPFVDARTLGAKCDGAITSGVVSGTDDTAALNTMAANTTVVIPNGKLCLLTGPVTIASGSAIRCETGAGFVLQTKQCNAGNFIGAPCTADADCYNGGGSTTGLCNTTTAFAPTGGTSYSVFQAPSSTPHREFGLIGCNIWAMQVSPYYTCSGSGARAGKTCTTNDTNANTGCPTNGACSVAGTPLSPSGVGKINPIDASNAQGRVVIQANTIRDLRITDQAIKGGSGSSTDPSLIVQNFQEPLYSGICCGTVFCGGSSGIPGSNGQTCDFNYGFNPPTTSIIAGIMTNDSFLDVQQNTVVGDTYGILVSGGANTLSNVNVFVHDNTVSAGNSVTSSSTNVYGIYVQNASQIIIDSNRVNSMPVCFYEDSNSANLTIANNRCYVSGQHKVVVAGGAGVKVLGNYLAWGNSAASTPIIQVGDNAAGAISTVTSHMEVSDNTLYDDGSSPIGIQFLDIGKRCATGTKKAQSCTTNDCNASTGCPGATGCPASCTGTCCGAAGSHANERIQNNLFLQQAGTGIDFSALTSTANTGLTNSIFSGNMIAGLVTGLNFPTTTGSISGLRFSSTHFGTTTNSLNNFDPSFGTIDSTIPLQPGDWSPVYAIAKYCSADNCPGAGAASTTWQAVVAANGTDNAVITAPASTTRPIIGVYWGSVADNGNATIVVGGVANCAVQGTVTHGDRLCISATAGKLQTCLQGQLSAATALASGTTTNVLCAIGASGEPTQANTDTIVREGMAPITASSSPITANGTETVFSNGTYNIASGAMAVGTTLRVTAWGQLTTNTTGTNTLNLRLRWGINGAPVNTDPLIADLQGTPTNSITSKGWFATFQFTCRTTGASGSLDGNGQGVAPNNIALFDNGTLGPVTVATNAAKTLALFWKWATASNSATLEGMTVEWLN